MSNDNKRKIDLSWLKLWSSIKKENDSTFGSLDVSKDDLESTIKVWEKITEIPELNVVDSDEVIEKKPSNKLSIAWMKEKRMWKTKAPKNNTPTSSQKDEVTSKETNNTTSSSKKTVISLNQEKVETTISKDNNKEAAKKIQNTWISLEQKKVEIVLDKKDSNKADKTTGNKETQSNWNNIDISKKEETNKKSWVTPISLKQKETEWNTTKDSKVITNVWVKKEFTETPLNLDDNKKEDNDGLFSNYTSDFEKDERSIIEKLKELWKEPKTRIMLVVGLIWMTILGIIWLFIFYPEKHSITHYKEVLIASYRKYTGNEPSPEIINKPIDNLIIDQPIWEDTTVIRNGYRISIKTQLSITWVKMYKFNNTEFDTMEKLNEEIDIEIKKLQTDKVKDFLLHPKTESITNTELSNEIEQSGDNELNEAEKKEVNNKNTEELNDETNEEKTQEAPRKSALQLLQERK